MVLKETVAYYMSNQSPVDSFCLTRAKPSIVFALFADMLIKCFCDP
jgi:hypothetical protein